MLFSSVSSTFPFHLRRRAVASSQVRPRPGRGRQGSCSLLSATLAAPLHPPSAHRANTASRMQNGGRRPSGRHPPLRRSHARGQSRDANSWLPVRYGRSRVVRHDSGFPKGTATQAGLQGKPSKAWCVRPTVPQPFPSDNPRNPHSWPKCTLCAQKRGRSRISTTQPRVHTTKLHRNSIRKPPSVKSKVKYHQAVAARGAGKGKLGTLASRSPGRAA